MCFDDRLGQPAARSRARLNSQRAITIILARDSIAPAFCLNISLHYFSYCNATRELIVGRHGSWQRRYFIRSGYTACMLCAVPEGTNITRAHGIVLAAFEKLVERNIVFDPLPHPHFQTMFTFMKKILVDWGLAHCRCRCASCDSPASPHRDHPFHFPWHNANMYAEVLVWCILDWESRGPYVYMQRGKYAAFVESLERRRTEDRDIPW